MASPLIFIEYFTIPLPIINFSRLHSPVKWGEGFPLCIVLATDFRSVVILPLGPIHCSYNISCLQHHQERTDSKPFTGQIGQRHVTWSRKDFWIIKTMWWGAPLWIFIDDEQDVVSNKSNWYDSLKRIHFYKTSCRCDTYCSDVRF